MAELDLGAAISLVIGNQDKQTTALSRLAPTKPVRTPFGGSTVQGASIVSPLILPVNGSPSAGRVWNVTKIGIFGGDAHTPISNPQPSNAGSFTASGSVTSPGALATIASLTLPAGSYDLQITSLASGTLAAGDNNNLRLFNVTDNVVIASPIVLDATTANAPTSPPPIPVVFTKPTTVAVQSIVAGSVGSIYTSVISAIPVNALEIYADIFIGQLPTQGSVPTAITPNLIDCIVPGADIPSVNTFSSKTIWAHQHETVYALLYNIPVNQTIVLTASVDDYPVEAVESLTIG